MASLARSPLATLLLATLLSMNSAGALKKWWESSIVYQIYPRSFQDSNADGIGDLKGIIQRIDHLSSIAVEAIWLSPIYKSPMKDFGYDVSDFKDIDPIFGTLEDFDQLVSEAHRASIKVLLDFIPNHSSDQHEWFQKSLLKVEPYTDYYVWVDPKGYDSDGQPIPPSNWVAAFGGSMWTFREERQQFYLHQYLPEQPDLNYRAPLLMSEIKSVLKFWLDRGVDGFRMDAVTKLWEDDSWLDEPKATDSNVTDPNDYAYYDHIYTFNQQQDRDILKEFHDFINEYSLADGRDRVTMLEVNLPIKEQMLYYDCGDLPFNFDIAHMAGDINASDILKVIDDWLSNVPDGKIVNWILGSHDTPRVGSRFAPELIVAFNIISLTLPGVSVVYYGEEIGMTNTDISFEDTVDPAGLNCGPEHYKECSRDPERTPMQWTPSKLNAGFSDAEKTWLPVNKNFPEVNVETENGDQDSHLYSFKVLSQLKKDPVFIEGSFAGLVKNNVLAFSRHVDEISLGTYLTIVNFNNATVSVDFAGDFHPTYFVGVVRVTSTGSKGAHPIESFAVLEELTLEPYEALVLQLVFLKQQ